MLLKRKESRERKPLFSSFGRRGAILCLMGISWILLGVGTLLSKPQPGTEYLLHVILVPSVVTGSVWVISGAVAIWYAHKKDDAVGFLALYVQPALLAVSYFLGWLDAVSPFGTPGYPRGWLATLFYVIMLLFIIICAGWPEPAKAPDEVLQHVEEGTHSGVEGAEYQ